MRQSTHVAVGMLKLLSREEPANMERRLTFTVALKMGNSKTP